MQETDNISTIAQNFISCAKMFDSSMHVVKCTFTWLQVRYYSTGSIRVYLHKKKNKLPVTRHLPRPSHEPLSL